MWNEAGGSGSALCETPGVGWVLSVLLTVPAIGTVRVRRAQSQGSAWILTNPTTNVHTEAALKINSGQIPEMGWGGAVLLSCQIPAEPKCQGNLTESTAGS